jgi:transcription antitermination factor NusG
MSTVSLIQTPKLPPPAPAEDEPSWYAVQTRCRIEKKIAAQLDGKGVETFLPMVRQLHCWSDRRKIVELAMLPGYVFARIALTSLARLCVLQTFGVLSFVAFNGKVPPIPNQQIEELRRLSENNIGCSETPFIKLGQRVRVRGGCLEGLECILLSRQGERKLILSIEPIQRSLSIPIGDYVLEPI